MKNRNKNRSLIVNLHKIILVVSILFISALSSASKVPVYAQPLNFTFEFNNTPIKNVFKYIEENSNFVFLYYDGVLKDESRISVKAINMSITQVLDLIFEKTPVCYEINGRQILLKKGVNLPRQHSLPKEERKIQGFVKDVKGDPVIGANVLIKGSSKGVVTNIDGLFQLAIPASASTLLVSYIGYISQEVRVDQLESVVIILEEDAKIIEEVVITAYGAGQKKVSMVGSVQQIRPSELKVPSSSLSSSFAGRMAGVIAVQRSGEPGADGSNFWIRGKATFSGATSALIILDGVEIASSELNTLDPEVIESFSILKDATATALYGTRGANGVMIVTTKSGSDLQKPIINFRVEGAVSQMSSVPEMVNGVTYMSLFNEAVARPGAGDQAYSAEKIESTRSRLNPYVYPDVDWYGEMFKKNAFSQRVNFNIRGGSKRMDYFMSASLKHSDGNLKSLSKNYFSYNNNINLYNYDFVNNLNVKITPTTKVSLGLNVQVKDWNGPKLTMAEIFSMSKEANPVDFPIRFPDDAVHAGDYDYVLWGDKSGGPYNSGFRNPIAEYVSGYKTSFESVLTANFKIAQKLDMLTPGLRFTGLFSFKNRTLSSVTRSSSYNHFEVKDFDPSTQEYSIGMIGTENGTSLTTLGSNSGSRKIYLQAMFEYNRKFRDMNDVNVMFLYNHEQYDSNLPTNLYASLPQRKQGIAGRIAYGYDNRYLIEANFGYNGSENFAKGNRFGFFPSIALGYNISEERFWEKLLPYFSFVKLRASWGLVGNDATGAGRFAYLEELALSGSPAFVTGIAQNVSLTGPVWSRLYNPSMTWEVGEKVNLGIDMQILNSLNLSIDGFKETRDNIFMSRSNTVPISIGTGSTRIYGNVGKMQNVGIDVALDYNKQLNKNLFVSFKSTFTFAQNKILERDEPPYRQYPNLSSIGQPLNRYLGYVADGLFPNQESIDNYVQQMLGYTPLPGDIKYLNQPDRDGNYDNVINANDRIYMGMPTDPEIVYGFGPSLKYKKWDLSFFFQGVARTSLLMYDFHPFGSTTTRGVMDFIAQDHWTEENGNIHATYPRLSRGTNANNQATSDYWLKNGAFLKLKNAEVGYTFKNMRFYLSGTNLLTFSPFKYWDPEMGSGNGLNYPTQRVFNIGFQMTIN